MNQELLKYIRILSENDPKSLTQKALKTTEELGELAKAILPFENAAGTLHRFSDRKKILENVADVFLTSISIAYDLKFSDEEIEEMIREKSRKWSGIQAKENEIKFPLPYEIHITIERPYENFPVKDERFDYFKSVCKQLQVKPIIIDLEKEGGELVMQDVMTSSVHYGNNRSAYDTATGLAQSLSDYHLKVLRTKIETVPWHPAAPRRTDDKFIMPPGCYFESHLRIIAKKSDREIIEKVAKYYDAHLSKNFFKKISEEEYIIMMTLRSYTDNVENFKAKVEALKKELTVNLSFVIDKVEIEFAIYDTKISHDAAWLSKI